MKSTIFTNTLTDRKPTDSLLRTSRKMLDCFATLDNNNKLSTTVYRKPTHTDRLPDQSSYNPTSHKPTTIQTLTRRAQLICDSPDSFADETQYLDNILNKNNHNKDKQPRDSCHYCDYTVIKGTSEPIERILQHYNIRVAHKPITTLRQLLMNVKDRDEPNHRQGAVYKIKCCDCQEAGEISSNFKHTTD